MTCETRLLVPGTVKTRVREIAVGILPPTSRTLGDAELFTAHGMDSMMATQFSCVLAESFGLVLSPAIALEFQTLEGLSERILELAAAQRSQA